MRLIRPLTPLVLLAALVAEPGIATGDLPARQDLDQAWDESYPTVVTAGRRDERAFESSHSISTVTREGLIERGVATSPEALEQTSGVYVQRTHGAGGSPIVRGLLGRHVLLLVDGIRLNNAITRFGPNQLLNTVDPFSLAHIEVLRGPGSVLYGSDALGGVVNLVSQPARFDPKRAWDLEGSGLLRFDSASAAVISHAEVAGHVRGIGARVGGTFRRFDDLTGGRDTGEQPFTSYMEGDVDTSLVWRGGAAGTLTLHHASVRQLDAPRTDRSTPTDFLIISEQYRDIVALDYELTRDSPWLAALQASLSYQLQRELRERSRLALDTLERQSDDVGTIGATLAAVSRLPYNELRYGIDVYHDRVNSSAEDETISTEDIAHLPRGRYVDGSTYTQLGGWVLDHVELGSRLALDVGGRVSAWIAEIPVDEPNDLPALDTTDVSALGSARARYLLGDGLNLIAGVSQGFRAPNIDDYSATGCSDQGYDVPHLELSAEKSISAEAGVKLDLWGVLRASLFYAFTFLDDLIVRQPLADAPLQLCGTADDGTPIEVAQTQRDNAEHGTVHAVEARVDVAIARRWELFSWLAWARGQTELDATAAQSEPMSHIPPLNGLAGLRYRAPKQRWFAELALRWAARQSRLSGADANNPSICPDGPAGCQGTDGYVTLGLRGGLRLRDEVRLLFAVENITNETYRLHGSALDGPGINARVGLELSL